MSYNGLTVPLDYGTWCCELVPASDYEGAGGGRLPFLSAGERRQLEDDCRTFDLYFRPNYDFRRTITADIDAIRSFMREHLNTVHWNLPTDNAGIERILKRAVADGRLTPVVNRERRIRARTERAPHAPQSWSATSRSGGGGAVANSSGRTFHQLAMDWMGLDSESAWDYIEKYNAMVERIDAIQAATDVKRTGAGISDDLLGVAESAAGVVIRDSDAAVASDGDLFFDDAGDVSTPLGDAEPFVYTNDQPIGDSFDIAKTPNLGEPGSWYTNPGSGQMRLYGDNGKPVLDLDFDHVHNGLQPHAHNWTNGVRDGGDDVVPFSPWNP